MQPTRVRFPGSSAFHRDLKNRVAVYFGDSKSSQRDAARMYLKTALILTWTAVSYALLMFTAVSWHQVLPLAFCLALGLGGIGFSVQHDANHGGYSSRSWVNRLFGVSLDLIGSSSYIWHWKHNVVHHTYTNISGIDVDVACEPFLRLAPDQSLRWYHRYQHLYIWFLYGLMPADSHFHADFRDLAKAKVGDQPIPRPSALVLTGTLAGKAFFFFWALILPLTLHATLPVLGVFAFVSFTLGIILTTTFQLAHCVDEADVMSVERNPTQTEMCWAEHQVRTTADFAPSNRVLTWYVGGLNFQVEHHLFPRICHVHYPALAKIVRAPCLDHSLPYHSHPSLGGAVASHMNRLRTLGSEVG